MPYDWMDLTLPADNEGQLISCGKREEENKKRESIT